MSINTPLHSVVTFIVGSILGYFGTTLWAWTYVWSSFDLNLPQQYTQMIGMFPLFSLINQPGEAPQIEFHHGLIIFSLSIGLLFIYLDLIHRSFSNLGKQYREAQQKS